MANQELHSGEFIGKGRGVIRSAHRLEPRGIEVPQKPKLSDRLLDAAGALTTVVIMANTAASKPTHEADRESQQ